jgi:hypothetical protein
MTCCVGMGIFIALGAMGPKIKGSSTLIRTNNAPIRWLFFNWKYFGFFFILKNLKYIYVNVFIKICKKM